MLPTWVAYKTKDIHISFLQQLKISVYVFQLQLNSQFVKITCIFPTGNKPEIQQAFCVAVDRLFSLLGCVFCSKDLSDSG